MHASTDKNNLISKICIVSTLAWPIKVYMGSHILRLSDYARISIVATQASELSVFFIKNTSFKDIKIDRKTNVLVDLFSFYRLWKFFKSNNFHCVHSIMPKSGLISMCAARVAGVPHRFHTFTGQVWITRTGLSRYLLKCADKAIAKLSTFVLADSFSQRDFLVANGIVIEQKIKVLGHGSISGVNVHRFTPNVRVRNEIRKKLNISASDVVFIFVGRLNRDKGIADLVGAFKEVASKLPNVRLMLVGDDEGWHPGGGKTWGGEVDHLVDHIPFTSSPESYMATADILCLPSYREGFGSVLIEAASVGLPTIASRIYGISDAVVDSQTGILHEPGNILQIVEAMSFLAINPGLRKKMGDAGRARAAKDFSENILTAEFESFYRDQGVL